MPFDGMQNLEDWQKHLLRAAEIVRERWAQGDYGGRCNDSRCALQAIAEAMGLDPHHTPHVYAREHPAVERLAGAVEGLDTNEACRVFAWNDRAFQTAENVASTMERVALAPVKAAVS